MDVTSLAEQFSLSQGRHAISFGMPAAEALDLALADLGGPIFLLIATPGSARSFDAIASSTSRSLCAARFDRAVPHVPDTVARQAEDLAAKLEVGSLVAFGGGTALDTAKAVAHELALPIIAIPTNFSGSEVTRNFGLTVDGIKRTIIDDRVLPAKVIYDPELVRTLKTKAAAESGVNAIAHAVEAIYAPNVNPMTASLAEAGIRHMVGGLRLWSADPTAEAARHCLVGAWLCGEVLAQVRMGLHHRICHVLGGTFGLAHATVHTVMLPYSIAFNLEAAPQLNRLRDLFPGESLPQGLAHFARNLGAATSLASAGLKAPAIAEAARLCLASPPVNPRAVSREDVENLLRAAHRGDLVLTQHIDGR